MLIRVLRQHAEWFLHFSGMLYSKPPSVLSCTTKKIVQKECYILLTCSLCTSDEAQVTGKDLVPPNTALP
jgi:hypothetical protein